MSAIEAKLLEVTGIKKKSKEDRQHYLKRLVMAVQKKSDDDESDEFWDSLVDENIGEQAQLWQVAGIDAINAGREAKQNDDEVEVEDFPDLEDADNGDDADEGEDDDDNEEKENDVSEQLSEEKTTKAKKAKATKTAKAPKEKAVKAVKVAKEKPAAKAVKATKAAAKGNGKPMKRGTGGQYAIVREVIYKDPSIKLDELLDRLVKKGLKPSKFAVSTIRSLTVAQLRELKARGNLKGIEID
jgi:hypothetical protein